MLQASSLTPKGYWWECTADPSHFTSDFASVAKVPLVKFFFELAASGWKQDSPASALHSLPNGALTHHVRLSTA